MWIISLVSNLQHDRAIHTWSIATINPIGKFIKIVIRVYRYSGTGISDRKLFTYPCTRVQHNCFRWLVMCYVLVSRRSVMTI